MKNLAPFTNKGFTLLELLISIGLIGIISFVGVGFYFNYNKDIELDSVSKVLISDLKLAQSKSMSGLDGVKWGVHIVNGTDDYYELFSTPTNYSDPTKNIYFKKYLSDGISFSTPNEGVNMDIIFDKISGRTTTTSIVLIFSGVSRTIDVSNLGSFNLQ